MYNIVNPLEVLLPEAVKIVIKNDRENYIPYLAEVEKFCSNRDIIIGGSYGIKLLTGEELCVDEFSIELYTDDVYNVGKELADQLYSNVHTEINNITIAMDTNLKDRIYTINVNLRQMIKLHKLGNYRDVKIFDVINPVKVNPMLYGGKVQIYAMREQIHLLNIYKNLYKPYPPTKKYPKYTQLVNYEQILYPCMMKYQRDKWGAFESPNVLTEKVFNNIIHNSEYIVIGDYAVEKLLGDRHSSKRLQIICSDIDELMAEVKQYMKAEAVKYKFKIPGDILLTKHTIYVHKNGKQQVLMEVYNSTFYELVPYKLYDNIRYGNLLVLMRFKLVDLYVLEILSELIGGMEKNIREILNQLHKIRNEIIKQMKNEPFNLFQLSDYGGIYLSDTLIRKKFFSSKKFKFVKYFPVITYEKK